MKKLLILLIFTLFISDYTLANQEVINSLKSSGKLIFIRHAYAPGGGDPDNFLIGE